jgi:RNA polymerase sigma factor (sigma-70 family)
VVGVDDRAMVAALVAGDQRGLDGAYRAYADRLYTYCRGMLRDPDAAADAVHDTFVLASQRAGQLREPDRLRSWLYAIARNECLRLLRGRARQAPLEEAGEVTAPEVDPVAGMRAAEIQELVWAAAAGLNSGDREVFELAVRHELPAPEVSELLGVSVAHAHARLSRARAQLERSLGALLVARTGRQECPELAELLGSWDGTLTALIRKRISRHIEDCQTCAEQQRRQLRPAALFAAYAGVPFLLAPVELFPRLQLTCFEPGLAGERSAIAQRAGDFHPATGFPRPFDQHRRRLAVAGVAAVAVAALLAAGGGALVAPEFLAADPGPLPTAAAAGSPSGSPTGSPSPSPTPTPTPTPSLSPSPDPPPPPPPPPPSPPPPTSTSPSPPPPPPPTLTIDDHLINQLCEAGLYTLTVTVRANLPLASGTLTLQPAPRAPVPPMEVNGLTASLTLGPLSGANPTVWSVVVTTEDQKASRSGTIPACSP